MDRIMFLVNQTMGRLSSTEPNNFFAEFRKDHGFLLNQANAYTAVRNLFQSQTFTDEFLRDRLGNYNFDNRLPTTGPRDWRHRTPFLSKKRRIVKEVSHDAYERDFYFRQMRDLENTIPNFQDKVIVTDTKRFIFKIPINNTNPGTSPPAPSSLTPSATRLPESSPLGSSWKDSWKGSPDRDNLLPSSDNVLYSDPLSDLTDFPSDAESDDLSEDATDELSDSESIEDIEPDLKPENFKFIAITVWMGMTNKRLVGPFFYVDRNNRYVKKTAQNHNEMLSTIVAPTILETFGDDMFYAQDGEPAQREINCMTTLRANFPGRLISREGDINWPCYSSCCNPLDFFLWPTLRKMVKARSFHNLETLMVVIEEEAAKITREQIDLAFTQMFNIISSFRCPTWTA